MQGWATLNFLRGRTTAVVLDSLVIKQGPASHGATHIVVQKFSWRTSNIALFDQKIIASFLAGYSVRKCKVLYDEMKQSKLFVFVCVLWFWGVIVMEERGVYHSDAMKYIVHV